MLDQVKVKLNRVKPLDEFLESHDYHVERVTDSVYKVSRLQELPVFLQVDQDSIYFESDLGNIAEFANQELYFKLLDLNTEILPVSLGIDTTNADDPRLVLVESREHVNLDENELLSVLNAIEIATDKVEAVLAEYVK